MEDRVEGKTRIVRWVVEEPVSTMAFYYGRFDVSHIQLDGVPPIAVYANRNRMSASHRAIARRRSRIWPARFVSTATTLGLSRSRRC